MSRRWTLWILTSLAVSCGDTERVAPLSELGAQLAADPTATGSRYNAFACLTCHPVRPGEQGARVLPGAPLQGAVRRPSFWGGETRHLREAVERCWVGFMRGLPTDLDGPNGQAVGAWLESLSPAGSTEGTAAVTLTWPRAVGDPGATGDPSRGQAVWARACAYCHGAFGTGAGRLGAGTSILPSETQREHCDDDLTGSGFDTYPSYMRAVVAEKVRHGSFLGWGGVMPPFATETLTDDQVRDLASLFTCP